MIVGVPKEVKDWETRVSTTPAGVAEYVARGHQVLVERAAGAGRPHVFIWCRRTFLITGGVPSVPFRRTWRPKEIARNPRSSKSPAR